MATTLPTTSLQVSLDEVFQELDALAALEPDWDGEGAPVIDAHSVEQARDLVSRIGQGVQHLDVPWQQPHVAPTPDGGISLSWDLVDSLHWLILHAGSTNVVHVCKDGEARPIRNVLLLMDAVDAIVLALTNSK